MHQAATASVSLDITSSISTEFHHFDYRMMEVHQSWLLSDLKLSHALLLLQLFQERLGLPCYAASVVLTRRQ